MDRLQIAEYSHADDYQSVAQPPSDIVVFNELRSCADLYRLHDTEQLEIEPFYQRDLVWSDADQTRFIDSLVKQLPIPSICLGYDYKQRKWIVIDGLQRLSSIIRFLNPKSKWVLSRIKDIDPSLAGADIAEVRNPESTLYEHYERVQNITIPVTVIRCDFSKFTHQEYLFKIFHRLNSGGMRLTNQEIRNCIYAGPFNSLLLELDSLSDWKKFSINIQGKKDRFRSAELLLRMFAMSDERAEYNGNLAMFLNKYMAANRHASAEFIAAKRIVFNEILLILTSQVTELVKDKKLGFSQVEALLVGLAENIDNVKVLTSEDFNEKFRRFLDIKLLKSEQLRNDISNTEHVKNRINAAVAVFS